MLRLTCLRQLKMLSFQFFIIVEVLGVIPFPYTDWLPEPYARSAIFVGGLETSKVAMRQYGIVVF